MVKDCSLLIKDAYDYQYHTFLPRKDFTHQSSIHITYLPVEYIVLNYCTPIFQSM